LSPCLATFLTGFWANSLKEPADMQYAHIPGLVTPVSRIVLGSVKE